MARVTADEIPPPNCRKCGEVASRYITRRSNRNGNVGRPYYRCCKDFYSFADLRGYHPYNPRCDCGLPSRMQIAGRERRTAGGLHFVCTGGLCDFYSELVDEDGEQERVNDTAIIDLLQRLRLI
ncbi:hypothetical protein LZ31DRAFT_479318 [Colletotrichum somersetense]|nr:hypothetical protein LZ31DRAFT_479318 [Colletotrichum somersetense]